MFSERVKSEVNRVEIWGESGWTPNESGQVQNESGQNLSASGQSRIKSVQNSGELDQTRSESKKSMRIGWISSESGQIWNGLVQTWGETE